MKTNAPSRPSRPVALKKIPKVSPAKRVPSAISPRTILVPIDFSPESAKALEYAAILARPSKAAITVLHVVEPICYVCDYGYGPVARERPNNELIKTVRSHLRRFGARHLADRSRWEAIVRTGAAFTEIIKLAKESGADLIVMPTRGLTPSKDVSLGSTAERVVRHAPCPVLTLKKSVFARAMKR